MAILGALTSLLAAAAYLDGSFVNAIVGGHSTTIDKFPYQVSVSVPDGPPHKCGGTILNEEWVLTSAHCIRQAKDTGKLWVRAGSSDAADGGSYHEVMSDIEHESFAQEGKAYLNNVALLRLKDKISFSDTVRPVKLATADQEPSLGQKLTLTGWGRVDDDTEYASVLQAVLLPALPRGLCQIAYANSNFTSDMICAGVAGKDFCNHDAGAPLMADTDDGLVQVGIASFALMAECGAPGFPSAFTNIADADIRQWIKDKSGL